MTKFFHRLKVVNSVSVVALSLLFAATGTATAQTAYRMNKEAIGVQLRTNAVSDLLACPNIGAELQTDCGIGWQLDYTGAWWNKRASNRFWSNYIFHTELRYYLDNKQQDTPFFGHHVGVYGQLVTYDFEFGGQGKMCRDLDLSWAVGASYGYTLPLSRSFNLDFTLGLGYFQSRYDVYKPFEGDYARIKTKKLHWFGPTKLEVSLVWNLNAKNVFDD